MSKASRQRERERDLGIKRSLCPILYHGTDEPSAIKALQNGFLPRKDKRGNFDEFPSNQDAVYLTNCYAPYFAAVASIKSNKRMAIVEIKVSEEMLTNFSPDEDYLEQSSRESQWGYSKSEISTRTKSFQTQMRALSSQWPDSLRGLGTVAHFGPIPSAQITQIALMDSKKFEWIVSYAGQLPICTLLHKTVSPHQRNLTRWIFGEKVTNRDVFGNLPMNAAGQRLLLERDEIEIITRTAAHPLAA